MRKDFKVIGDKSAIVKFRKILSDTSSDFNLEYLISVLNSKFGYYFFHTKRRSQLGFYPDDLKQLLIKNISFKEQQPFIQQDYRNKKNNPKADTSALEKQIDEMVYKLYELTDEEIKIIEGN